ncbi:SAV_2336 N-terminal domain-related protein [Parafrankia sp. EUN1f]|uniref:SAV_2336 N-terminal domain-related protein n=1 Tax=Parafrankia sp. EUN1f TaxID=102897 RepID=UPI0001C455C2|nr:SAV_2336 N-terminal domain-related protein [Parafrankia sp. EUN1f]EFC84333.1 hypothetical protein FrEUN1fDRAFT_2514 [Parafrankia sp. EUN1f]
MTSAAGLVRSLRDVGIHIDPEALADALLLALRAGGIPRAGDGDAGEAVQRTSGPDSAEHTHTDAADPPGPKGLRLLGPNRPASGTTSARSPVFDTRASEGTIRAHEVFVPRARALPRPLGLARAARPLRMSHRNGIRQTLDLAATAAAYADTGSFLPILRPVPERRFDLELIVDDTATMAVWQGLAVELFAVFQQAGVFRTVRQSFLDLDGDLVLSDASHRHVPLSRLRGAQSRRLVVLFTDCMHPAWATDTLPELAWTLGSAAPTVLVNPLPSRLWDQTALGGAGTRWAHLTNRQPGANNRHLAVAAASPERPLPGSSWAPLPVVTVAPYSLAAWAALLAGRAQISAGGVLFNQDTGPGTDDSGPAPGPAGASKNPPREIDEQSAAELVQAFRLSAPAAAFRLAVLGATNPTLSLSVLQLLRQEVVVDANVSDLAEFIVSGLVKVDRDRHGEVILTYHHEMVRQALLRSMAASDRWAVVRALSNFVPRQDGRAPRFAAAAAGPTGDVRVPPGLAPFATADQATLHRLGVRSSPATRVDPIAQSGTRAAGPPRQAPSTGSAQPAGPRPPAPELTSGLQEFQELRERKEIRRAEPLPQAPRDAPSYRGPLRRLRDAVRFQRPDFQGVTEAERVGAFPREVRCPICLYVFDEWPDAYEGEFYEYDPQRDVYEPVDEEVLRHFREDDLDPRRLRFQAWLATKYLRCPNPFKDTAHYLFYPYGWYGDPFVIGMVGATAVGKSHLLAAMIGQLVSQRGLDDLGLSVTAVDPRRHREYVRTQVNPLLVRSEVLPATLATSKAVSFVDAVIITNLWTGRSRLVTFYDIRGEDFDGNGRSADFVNAAGGLVFVVDPHHSGLVGRTRRTEDKAFNAVLAKLRLAGRMDPHTGLYDVDAAVVVNKSDLLRFQPPVQDWYHRKSPRDVVDLDLFLEESRDAYALLHSQNAAAWLAPVHECRRATLHFASATGVDVIPAQGGQGPRFYDRVQPNRVLEPLVALLTNAGIIDPTVLYSQDPNSRAEKAGI